MAELVLKDVRKTYAGAVEAVKGVSLDIHDGELLPSLENRKLITRVPTPVIMGSGKGKIA